MRGYYIYKTDLQELYGNELVVRSDLDSTESKKLEITKEKYRVEILNRSGKLTSVSTLSVAGNQKRFTVLDHMVKEEEVLTPAQLFTPVLERLMPGRYQFTPAGRLYLHYPELTIKNSLNQQHTIYDLIAMVSLDSYGRFNSDLLGTRASYTKEELKYRYVHSHLSRLNDHAQFSSFCTGDGSPFKKLLLNYTRVIDAFEFEVFLVQLQEYLSWESLEGRPYISIKEFKQGGEHSPNAQHTSATVLDQSTINAMNDLVPVIVKELNNGLLKDCVVVNQDRLFFDPCLDSTSWIKFEQLHPHALFLTRWNPHTATYVGNNPQQTSYSLPRLHLPEQPTMLTQLNPRIVTTQKTETQEPVLINRYYSNIISFLTSAVNYHLLLATYKHG